MNGDSVSGGLVAAGWNYGYLPMDSSAVFSPTTHGAIAHEQVSDGVKRTADVVLSLVGIVLALPLCTLIALAIKLTSKGPVLFVQERAGLNGRPFRMFKFRSMVIDAEERLRELVRIEDLAEPVYKLRDDPRVTRLGRFLRRFGLDEIPQLLNVLRGEMSLVGPRPEVVALAERYNGEQRRRLRVKPGITGYQQIHNRGMPDMAARLSFDLFYMRNQSTLLDLWILTMTVFVIASGREITY